MACSYNGYSAAYEAQERQLRAQYERQRMMGPSALAGCGAAQGLAQSQARTPLDGWPTPTIIYRPEPKGIREELQAETDEWLKGY